MGTILIENCDVIDGMGNQPMRGMDVLIEGNRIARLSRRVAAGHENLPAEVRRIDGAGKTVMPGLIDAHCHMTYGESLTQEEQDIFTSVEAARCASAWNVQKVLVRRGDGDFAARRELLHRRRGTGRHQRRDGQGSADDLRRSVHHHQQRSDRLVPRRRGLIEGGIGIRCNTLDEMIAEVRRQVKNGVDFIKLADSPYGEFQSFRDVELHDDRRPGAPAERVHDPRPRRRRDEGGRPAGFDWVMHGNMMTQRDSRAARRDVRRRWSPPSSCWRSGPNTGI